MALVGSIPLHVEAESVLLFPVWLTPMFQWGSPVRAHIVDGRFAFHFVASGLSALPNHQSDMSWFHFDEQLENPRGCATLYDEGRDNGLCLSQYIWKMRKFHVLTVKLSIGMDLP